MSSNAAIRKYPDLARVPAYTNIVRLMTQKEFGLRKPLRGCRKWISDTDVVNWASIKSVLRKYPDWDGSSSWKYRLLKLVYESRDPSDVPPTRVAPPLKPKTTRRKVAVPKQRSLDTMFKRPRDDGTPAPPHSIEPTTVPPVVYYDDSLPLTGPVTSTTPSDGVVSSDFNVVRWLPDDVRRECVLRICGQKETVATLACESHRQMVARERFRSEAEHHRLETERVHRETVFAQILQSVDPRDRSPFIDSLHAMIRGTTVTPGAPIDATHDV